MSFAFQALADDSLASRGALRLVSTVAVLLLVGIFVVTAGHINMGWAGNEFIGP